MKHVVLTMMLGAVAAVTPAMASAQDRDGWYASASGTLSVREGTDGTIANAPAPGSTVRTESDFQAGYGGQIAIGRKVGRFRFEAEFGYARDTQNSYTAIVPPTGKIAADVVETATRGMINGYVDLTRGPIQPYLGAGAGVARIHVLFVAPRAPFPTEAPRTLIDDGDTRFAYQLIGGVAFKLGPNLALTAQYRWFDAGTLSAKDVRGEAITRKHSGHNFDLGFRLSF
ncbi:MAG: outer membrane beta-barrel protein [Pseudomonadota bacterium]